MRAEELRLTVGDAEVLPLREAVYTLELLVLRELSIVGRMFSLLKREVVRLRSAVLVLLAVVVWRLAVLE